MPALTHVTGDLLALTPPVDVILQQCNCVSRTAKGLSEAIARRYPYADVYRARNGQRSTPGTVHYAHPSGGAVGPVVGCLMAQVSLGRPGAWAAQYGVDAASDTAARRLEYFAACLQDVAEQARVNGWASIAVPHGIGCGLAGGRWADDEAALTAFAERLPQGVTVSVVRLP